MFIQLQALVFELSNSNQTLWKTKLYHALLIKTRLLRDPFYATKIIRFYEINGDLFSARKLFDETPQRSVYLWNSIIRAYARAHRFVDLFRLFKRMIVSETTPDSFTFACVLRACSERLELQGLRLVHGKVIASGLGLDSIVGSTLVTAYSKFDLVHDASLVFARLSDPDLVLWNSMISGYGGCGYWDKACHLFSVMRNTGKQPDGYSLVGLILSFMDSTLLDIGQAIHGFSLKTGFDSSAHVVSALVSMYSRCNCMSSAHRVFDGLSNPDLVTWSALISGFSQSGGYKKALVFFKRMCVEGRKADSVLIASLLAVTAQLAIVGPGIEMHGYAIRHGFGSDIMVSSALIDMYSKCGFLGLGTRAFNNMPKKNIVSFNSMIGGFGLYGFAYATFEIFREILEKGLQPDESTFCGLLSACCHAGLVKDGREIFRGMEGEFGIKPKAEHYVHLVKLLGMAGELEEAYDLIHSLPEPVDSGIWGALLSCCEVHKNPKLAELVAKRIIDNKPEKRTYKIVLSNLYAGDGRWDDVGKLRDELGDAGQVKLPGISWIGN